METIPDGYFGLSDEEFKMNPAHALDSFEVQDSGSILDYNIQSGIFTDLSILAILRVSTRLQPG